MVIRRIVLAFLIFLNIFLAYRLFLGDTGLQAYLELKNKYAEMDETMKATEKASMDLSREIRMLKSNDEYLADTIRKRMNYVENNELLYLFSDKTSKDLAAQAAGAGFNEDED